MGNKNGRLRRWAQRLRVDVSALYLAYRDPRTPWYAKLLAIGVAAYALSPIDLIPDFIPILGYVDDLVLVPLGIALAVRMIPRPVLDDCRRRAQEAAMGAGPEGRVVAILIVVVWLVLAAVVGRLVWKALS